MIKNKNPFDYFEAIYCINLDRRTDRWAQVQKEFEKVGIQDRVIRFSAVETPENGAIGCLISHRNIIQRAKEVGYKNILIFEDDVKFNQDITYIGKIVNELKQSTYDVFYFGGLFNIDSKKIAYCDKVSKNLRRISDLWCLLGVSYCKNFYEIFLSDYPDASLNGIKKSDIFQKYKSIDDRLIYHQRKYIFLAPKKIICTVSGSKSDIQNFTLQDIRMSFIWFIFMKRIVYKIYRILKYTKNLLIHRNQP